ncbi:MAG: DUF839 domain-containing protein [Saprospiraceae bacterium]|nr:DUF839 domain-containing protein [Saprospiraceae bacterium]
MHIRIIHILTLLLIWDLSPAQHISEFTSVIPGAQDAQMHIPSSHTYQYIIEHGDSLTAGGTIPDNFDFTGYVPIDGSSAKGYLSINSERITGGVTILDIFLDHAKGQWLVSASQGVDFGPWGGTSRNCSGTITPWNTVISCEEEINVKDDNSDLYFDYGWAVEIDPMTRTVVDKLWALGNFEHENAAVHDNRQTVYQGVDADPGYLYKFVADAVGDLSAGKLYTYRGAKSGTGEWIRIPNSSIEERNQTKSLSADVNATVFDGIEDVEIGLDGMVYVAVKGEGRVYRFRDEDPFGDIVTSFETFVGGQSYEINYDGGTSMEPWGSGNDNLAFDELGNLWVLQDGSRDYIWLVRSGHTQDEPKVEIFGRSPAGSEPTGITFTPDYRYLFMSFQHPSADNSSAMQGDAFGNPRAFDKDVAIVIARNEYLGDAIVATKDYGEGSLDVYPNPASNFLSVRLPQEVQISHIKIIDASGRIIRRITCQNQSHCDIEIGGITPGVLYLLPEAAERIRPVKVIIF